MRLHDAEKRLSRHDAIIGYYHRHTQSALTMSASMPSGLVVGAYRSMVLPSLPTKNFAKFHLTSEPAMAIKPLSDLLSFRCFQNGLAFAPFTSIFANSGNLAPYLPANALISAAEPGSCAPN